MLRTLSSAPVRLFGWVAQNHAGVTYETLGINGAQANLMLDWNSAILAAGADEPRSRPHRPCVWNQRSSQPFLDRRRISRRLDRNHPPAARRGSSGQHSPDRAAGLRISRARPPPSVSASGSGDRDPARRRSSQRLRLLGLARRDGRPRIRASMGAGGAWDRATTRTSPAPAIEWPAACSLRNSWRNTTDFSPSAPKEVTVNKNGQ